MNEIKREIRKALLGDLAPSDGVLVVTGSRIPMFRNGIKDGFGRVLFFGIICRRRWYKAKKKKESVMEDALKAMQGMGRMVALESAPDSLAVFTSYLTSCPAIMTFTAGDDGSYEAAAYSGRGIVGFISVFRMQNSFRDAVEGRLERLSEEKEADLKSAVKNGEDEEKKRAGEAKKEKKKEKKLARKAKRRKFFSRSRKKDTAGDASVKEPSETGAQEKEAPESEAPEKNVD